MGIRFNKILDKGAGIRFMFEDLNISSSLSSSVLLESSLKIAPESINTLYSNLQNILSTLFEDSHSKELLSSLHINLCKLRDIRNTLSRLDQGKVCDDIELYEIKNLVIINQNILSLTETKEIYAVDLPDHSYILDLLDPEGYGISSFYIYDSYDETLASLRKQLKKDNQYNQERLYKCEIIEERIRKELSAKIRLSVQSLMSSLLNLANLDILIAKTDQLKRLGLVIPEVGDNETRFCDMFNPEVKHELEKNNFEYHNTSIAFSRGITLLITGSNMGGKSLTLKTLALCQYLFQFGFGIPAAKACIAPVQEIHILSGDHENLKKGISSFAAEIRNINQMISAIKNHKQILALIDEPARTTNPSEGAALASALVTSFYGKESLSVMTTHYTINNERCSRLRVRGFVSGKMNYSLEKDNQNEAPAEALNIAESLGADSEWIDNARLYISNKIN